MPRRSVPEILAHLGQHVTVELDEDEEPYSVTVTVKTYAADGRVRVRPGEASAAEGAPR